MEENIKCLVGGQFDPVPPTTAPESTTNSYDKKSNLQQDIPPHYHLPVQPWLVHRFPSVDLFLWVYLKYIVYITPPDDIEEQVELQVSIPDEFFENVKQVFSSSVIKNYFY